MTEAPISQGSAQAEHDLDALTFAIGHDLAAPVRRIKGFADLALTELEQDPKKARAHLEKVRKAVTQLERMLDVMLRLSRVGRIEEAHEYVPLHRLVEEGLLAHGRALSARGISIDFTGDLTLYGEPKQLGFIVDEAIGNIAHHAGPGARGVVRGTDEGTHWFIDFIDDGEGIPEPRFDDAMQLFRQIVHQPPAFLGSGLAMMRRIAVRHGGDVTLIPHAGTHLRVSLAKPN